MPILRQPVSKQKAGLARQLRSSMTPAEKILWEKLRTNRLGGLHFRRQQVIQGFIVDFYCHAARLVVEVDGEIHRVHAADDLERERILGEAGFRVIRFTNDQIETDLDMVLAAILQSANGEI